MSNPAGLADDEGEESVPDNDVEVSAASNVSQDILDENHSPNSKKNKNSGA